MWSACDLLPLPPMSALDDVENGDNIMPDICQFWYAAADRERSSSHSHLTVSCFLLHLMMMMMVIVVLGDGGGVGGDEGELGEE